MFKGYNKTNYTIIKIEIQGILDTTYKSDAIYMNKHISRESEPLALAAKFTDFITQCDCINIRWLKGVGVKNSVSIL